MISNNCQKARFNLPDVITVDIVKMLFLNINFYEKKK